jgi:hypothetical protein
MHEPGFVSTYAYILLSTSLLVVWLVLYGLRPDLRRQILWISLGTMPLGLTEPLFVPAYRNPPTLLDLARSTGFDFALAPEPSRRNGQWWHEDPA